MPFIRAWWPATPPGGRRRLRPPLDSQSWPSPAGAVLCLLNVLPARRHTDNVMKQLPETVLQFGSGRFLRAFAYLFIHQANQQGQGVGRVVIVQSTGDSRAGGLNRQGGRYHVVVRGLQGGAEVDRVEPCESV